MKLAQIYMIALLIMMPLPMFVHAELYGIQQEDGSIIYTDHVPADKAKNPHRTISADGITKSQQGRALTEEEIKAKVTAERQARQEKLAAEAQEREDKKLIDAFNSVDELILARDDKLASLESRVNLALSNIRKLQTALAERTTNAANLERSGAAVSKEQQAAIESLKKDINDNERAIQEYREQQRIIREQFQTDKKRLIEILQRRGKSESAKSKPGSSNAAEKKPD